MDPPLSISPYRPKRYLYLGWIASFLFGFYPGLLLYCFTSELSFFTAQSSEGKKIGAIISAAFQFSNIVCIGYLLFIQYVRKIEDAISIHVSYFVGFCSLVCAIIFWRNTIALIALSFVCGIVQTLSSVVVFSFISSLGEPAFLPAGLGGAGAAGALITVLSTAQGHESAPRYSVEVFFGVVLFFFTLSWIAFLWLSRSTSFNNVFHSSAAFSASNSPLLSHKYAPEPPKSTPLGPLLNPSDSKAHPMTRQYIALNFVGGTLWYTIIPGLNAFLARDASGNTNYALLSLLANIPAVSCMIGSFIPTVWKSSRLGWQYCGHITFSSTLLIAAFVPRLPFFLQNQHWFFPMLFVMYSILCGFSFSNSICVTSEESDPEHAANSNRLIACSTQAGALLGSILSLIVVESNILS